MVYSIIVWGWAIFMHFMHPFHISVTEVSFNENNKHLEISIRIFSDDLEKVLEQYGKMGFDLIKSMNDTMVLTELESYLESNFIIKENDSIIPWYFLGAKADGDVVWCFIESEPVKAPETIWVRNTLLLDLFDDQINLVHLTIGNTTRSTKYYRGHYSGPVILK